MKATAAILNQPNGPFSLETVDVADPQAGEVRVKIRAVGICHTDLVIASGAMGLRFPAVLGHEGAGRVDAVGAGVTTVKPGDKVLLTFNSCGACKPCGHHKSAYCNHFVPLNMLAVRNDGTTRITRDGQPVADNFFGQSSFASLAIANERNVLKLDDDADLVALAPLGCSIQTGAGGVLRSLAAKAGGRDYRRSRCRCRRPFGAPRCADRGLFHNDRSRAAGGPPRPRHSARRHPRT